MPSQLSAVIVASALSSMLFLLVAGMGLGFAFFFLPCLPLFFVGFSGSYKNSLQAGAISSLIIAILSNDPLATGVFFFSFAVPCAITCYFLSQHQDIRLTEQLPVLRLWYPVGMLIIHLAIYACVAVGCVTAFYATQEANLPQQLAALIQSQVSAMEKEYDMVVEVSPSLLTFLPTALFAWLWVISLWASAVLANQFVIMRSKNFIKNRPSLAVAPFPIPNWLLTLMSIFALASLIGSESMSFWGKTSLIILLLPYFFQGAAIMHGITRNWAVQGLFLFFVYFSIAILLWPAFILSGIGLWNHIKILNKHLSSGGNSHKV